MARNACVAFCLILVAFFTAGCGFRVMQFKESSEKSGRWQHDAEPDVLMESPVYVAQQTVPWNTAHEHSQKAMYPGWPSGVRNLTPGLVREYNRYNHIPDSTPKKKASKKHHKH